MLSILMLKVAILWLERLGRDLTKMASIMKQMTPHRGVIARYQLMQTFDASGRSQNNPILDWRPGVGKTTIVEDWRSALLMGVCHQNCVEAFYRTHRPARCLSRAVEISRESEERLLKVLEEAETSGEISSLY